MPKAKKTEMLLLTAIVIIAVIALVFAFLNIKTLFFWDNESTANGNTVDKCKALEGYTEEEWKEHMSHHPDQYKECLE